MKKSRVFTLGVACFFCAITALGVIPFCGINNGVQAGATASSNSANLAGAAQLGASAPSQAIQLAPQTDETIFTTESGFEIKSHNVAGQTLANSKVQYFTLGSYNGTPINWIILAASPTMVENTTPAGKAINADSSKQTLSMMTDSKLSANQMLVISEKVFENAGYSFSVTAKATTSLNIMSYNSSYYSSDCIATGNLLAKLLLDEHTDYHTSGSDNPSLQSSVNTFAPGPNLGLETFLGNKIVQNSGFSSNYVFSLTSSQFQSYLSTSLWLAKNIIGENKAYLLADITGTTSYTTSSTRDSGGSYWDYYGRPKGSGTATVQIKSIDVTGALTGVTAATISGTVTNDTGITDRIGIGGNGNYYCNAGKGTYSLKEYSTLSTKFFRPAMVVDLSKF